MFDRLHALSPEGRTYRMELPWVGPDAAIELKFAGESNRPYFSALLRRTAKRVRKGRNVRLDPETVRSEMVKGREEDRELYPAHVMTSNWWGINDDEGSPVENTLESRKEFCQQLPVWIFDMVRNAAAAPENFVEEDEEPPDPQELAGN